MSDPYGRPAWVTRNPYNRRYTIRSVTGFTIGPHAARVNGQRKPRTTYYVLDRLHAWQIVHTTDKFRQAVRVRKALNAEWHEGVKL